MLGVDAEDRRGSLDERLNLVDSEQIKNDRDGGVTVMFLDIDHFRIINDSLGHAKGDALHVDFLQHLSNCLFPEDTVSRFGGDEFAILIDGIDSVDEVEKLPKMLKQISS